MTDLRPLLLEAVLLLAKITGGTRPERFEGMDEAKAFLNRLPKDLAAADNESESGEGQR